MAIFTVERGHDGSMGSIEAAPKTHASHLRVEEAISELRYKDVRSTTLERLKVTWEADNHVKGLDQPLQLGEGLYYLLDNIAVPVCQNDLILGRVLEEVPDEKGEEFFQKVVEAWNGRSVPPWMTDGGHECFAWDNLVHLGLSGLEALAQRELERRIADGESEARLNFLRGAIRVYQAFRNYARRYAAVAHESGLFQAARNCANIAETST